MRKFEGALKASLILTRNHFSTQALAQRNQILALGGRGEVEWMLKWGFVSWLVSNEWGGRTSDMGSELPRSAGETQQCSHIGSSDPGSVLPRTWPKLASEAISVASEAISVLPTRRRYYRQRLGVEGKRSNWHESTWFSSHSLRLSPKALLASLGNQFASPFIVRCFLYSSSKSRWN
jgi:hypothetical protein